MRTKSTQILVGTVTALIMVPVAAHGTVYQIHTPISTYEYLVPPEGPGVPGCQPDDFHCLFGISGTLEFEIDLMAGNGNFVGADLQLTGNESTAAGPGFPAARAAALENFLINLGPIPLQAAVGSNYLFMEPIPAPPAIWWNSLAVRISGDQFSLSGAYDRTFADGEGHSFGVLAGAVPEPSLSALALCCVAAASHMFARCQRDRCSYQRWCTCANALVVDTAHGIHRFMGNRWQIGGGAVIFDLLDPLRARDRAGDRIVHENPPQCELRERPTWRADCSQLFDCLQARLVIDARKRFADVEHFAVPIELAMVGGFKLRVARAACR